MYQNQPFGLDLDVFVSYLHASLKVSVLGIAIFSYNSLILLSKPSIWLLKYYFIFYLAAQNWREW